jgi:starvation-inducible DNA-binding protein
MEAQLNQLLASYQIHYQNLRALHWNIKGANFFELHLKYEELYNRVQIIIDDLAERILTLGYKPLFTYNDYIQKSKISENKFITEGKEGMTYIFEAQQRLLELEREISVCAEDLKDEGTLALMSDLIREKEKTNWMFKAWLTQ